VPRGGLVSGNSALIHLAGWTPTDMTLKAPVGLHVQWPRARRRRMTLDCARGHGEGVRTPDGHAAHDVRRRARVLEGASTRRASPAFRRHDRDVKWDAMRRALRGEIPVFFHATTLAQIKAVLEFVDEQKLTKVVLVSSGDAWRIADELARRKIAVIAAGYFDRRCAGRAVRRAVRAAGQAREAACRTASRTTGKPTPRCSRAICPITPRSRRRSDSRPTRR
jgi:hypothetical protein